MKSPDQHISETQADSESERIASLEATNAELTAENERLRKLAYTDELTGLPNRHKFKKDFEEERRRFALAEASGEKENPDAILLVDLDNFKIVNDAFEGGHVQGDRILQEAAQHLVDILKEQFREDDLVARYGGEEFLILLKNVDVEAVIKRLNLGFETELDGKKVPITFSGGLTVLNPGEGLLDALSRADTALYAAKEDKVRKDGTIDRGRDRVFQYTDKMKELKNGVPVRS